MGVERRKNSKQLICLFASTSGKRLAVEGQNRLKTSAPHPQGHCGFQFSVAIADESSRKSRFNNRPSGEQQAERGTERRGGIGSSWALQGGGWPRVATPWLVLRESSIYPPRKDA